MQSSASKTAFVGFILVVTFAIVSSTSDKAFNDVERKKSVHALVEVEDNEDDVDIYVQLVDTAMISEESPEDLDVLEVDIDETEVMVEPSAPAPVEETILPAPEPQESQPGVESTDTTTMPSKERTKGRSDIVLSTRSSDREVQRDDSEDSRYFFSPKNDEGSVDSGLSQPLNQGGHKKSSGASSGLIVFLTLASIAVVVAGIVFGAKLWRRIELERIRARRGSRLEYNGRDWTVDPDMGKKVESFVPEIVEDGDLLVEEEEEEEVPVKVLEGPLSGQFRQFSFVGDVDIFFRENNQKQLNLRDCYLYDREARVYAVPFCSEEVPDEFQHYQVMEWDTWISGDSLMDEVERTELQKVFFAKWKVFSESLDREIDFKELYVADGSTRKIEKSEVLDFTDENTVDPVLCIKEGQIGIQDSRDCPTMEGYAQALDLVEYLDAQLAAKEGGTEIDDEMLAEIAEEEFDEPDTPESDNY